MKVVLQIGGEEELNGAGPSSYAMDPRKIRLNWPFSGSSLCRVIRCWGRLPSSSPKSTRPSSELTRQTPYQTPAFILGRDSRLETCDISILTAGGRVVKSAKSRARHHVEIGTAKARFMMKPRNELRETRKKKEVAPCLLGAIEYSNPCFSPATTEKMKTRRSLQGSRHNQRCRVGVNICLRRPGSVRPDCLTMSQSKEGSGSEGGPLKVQNELFYHT